MTDVFEHVYEAELLLSLAGEPETRSEMFLAAQTRAILALVRSQSKEPDAPPEHPIPGNVRTAFRNFHPNITDTEIIDIVRKVVVNEPAWAAKKIQAIKELRSFSLIGLKESKDVVEQMFFDVNYPWW